uniref:Uncharacterized protein n=1 Tax=Oryza punctata TaxID=4537 RepID=A0A0E0MIJ1_ORYPU
MLDGGPPLQPWAAASQQEQQGVQTTVENLAQGDQGDGDRGDALASSLCVGTSEVLGR